MSASLHRSTTITVTERTRRLLESVKGEGESFDEMLRGLLEDASYDDDFFREIERRWGTEKRVPGPKVFRRAGLT